MKLDFSLLRPSASNAPEIAENFDEIISQLGLESMFYGLSDFISEYFTTDITVIEFRQNLFKDVLEHGELSAMFLSTEEKLSNINELHKLKELNGSNESDLYTIKEVEVFINLIEELYEVLNRIHGVCASESIALLYASVREQYESEEYTSLKSGVKSLSFSVKAIKSLTVGINLDANLSPYESGIININDSVFRSGDLFSRFMRMDFKGDDMMTLAPLSNISGKLTAREKDILDGTINQALQKIAGNGLKEWKKMLHKYFMIQTSPYLHLLPEIRFINKVHRILSKIRKNGFPMTFPIGKPLEEKAFDAQGLYNPVMADDPERVIVYNNITFDDNGRMFVLTGANGGGKTVFIKAVGAAQIMFQLGLPVAAKQLKISPADHLFAHFLARDEDGFGKGHFEEECLRLQRILKEITPYSMLLMDETFSGTDSYEASIIAEEILTAVSVIGCRGVFGTHLHQLSQAIPDINEKEKISSRLDDLSAEMVNGKRTYRILRRKSDGKSHAKEVAGQYNLSFENILSWQKKKND